MPFLTFLIILILGLLAPFVVVYGTVIWLLAFPLIFAGQRWLYPWWISLPRATRRDIRWRTMWVLSVGCWTFAITHWATH